MCLILCDCVLNSWNIGVSYFRTVNAILERNQSNLYVWKYFDVTPFVTVNIFIITSNCSLITIFKVTVTDYIYFVIKLRNSVACN